MNRLFGSKNTAPKPTLEGAISNVRSPLLGTCHDDDQLTKRKGRQPRLQPRRQARLPQHRTKHLPSQNLQNARRPRQNRAAPKSPQNPATPQTARIPTRPAHAAILEHGAGGDDARQPQEHDDDGGRDEDDDKDAEEAVWEGGRGPDRAVAG